jgi:aldose 1-epimerase
MRNATLTLTPYGALPDGTAIEKCVLSNRHGVEVHAITYGGIITSLLLPGRDGRRGDVVLGHDTLEGYLRSSPYFGAIVGRHANRIAQGRLVVDGRVYQLATNNGLHHLHGGVRGFDKHVWQAQPADARDGIGVTFFRTSPAGEEGYPGTLQVQVSYVLSDANELAIEYEAATDAPTSVNLTQHTYFDLSAGASTDILDHRLHLNASHYTPVDEGLIPTGDVAEVANTPFAFRTGATIGARIDARDEQLRHGRGYDHNWVIDGTPGTFRHAAVLTDPGSGRSVSVWTTEPGIQFYSGNLLDGTITGKRGRVYVRRSGCCLETQHFPDAPSHVHFPSTIVRPQNPYRSRTSWRFAW